MNTPKKKPATYLHNAYLAIRWGNPYDQEQYDGEDTCFIVLARNKTLATKEIENFLTITETQKADFKKSCDVIYELGYLYRNTCKTKILVGPIYDRYMHCKPVTYIKMWEIDYNTGILQRKKDISAKLNISSKTCNKVSGRNSRNSIPYIRKTYLIVHKENPYNKSDVIYIVLASNKTAAMKIAMQETQDLLQKEYMHHYFILELGNLLCKKIRSIKLSGPIYHSFSFNDLPDSNMKYWNIN